MEMPLADALSMLGREALRIVLPAWCAVCACELPWRDRIASCCADCWRSLPRIATAKCSSCAMPLVEESVCLDCQPNPLPVDWCEAWGRYSGGLERVLRAFKFGRADFFDAPLASLMASVLRDRDFDVVVPVPMAFLHEQRRGYNQAELLARALGNIIDIDCELLLATRGSRRTQSRLAAEQRAANVRGAFTASPRAKGKRVLIVDDVCTTGETLRACALALRDAGAARVCAITVAKTI
ncbi:MAG TPA: ComF family protein [Thermoanaerobaculia bacterium]|nr:ComF family protein [Thermoanaerobaculia bacterium]